MFTVITDVFKGIGLLLRLLWEETATFAEPYWLALKRFLLYGTLVPFIIFILGFILRSTILLTLGGIFLCLAFVLVMLAFAPLIALVGKFLKKDDQAGSRFIKTILSVWLWELLTVFYCVVFPVWNDYRSLLLVALCALILSLASVVWGVGYITWFRKVLVALVALVFVFCTVSFFLPATARTLRNMLPDVDQYLNRLLSTKRAAGDLIIADINRDGFLDSLDVKWLKRFTAYPKEMPDSTRGDVNADGKIDAADVKYLEDYLYNGGWPPRLPKLKPVPVRSPVTKDIQIDSEGSELNTVALNLNVTDNDPLVIKVPANSMVTLCVDSAWYMPDLHVDYSTSTTRELWCNANGYEASANFTGSPRADDYPAPNLNRYSLIYRVSGKFWQPLRMDAKPVIVNDSGYRINIEITLNDVNNGFSGNKGIVRIKVETRSIRVIESRDGYRDGNTEGFTATVSADQNRVSEYFLDTTVQLDTHQPFWTEYPVVVRAGVLVQFSATGSYTWDPGISRIPIGPDGGNDLAKVVGRPQEFLMGNDRVACLIGNVGGQIFSIGSQAKIVIEKGGVLQLGINERWRSGCWDDNSGTIIVHIKVIS